MEPAYTERPNRQERHDEVNPDDAGYSICDLVFSPTDMDRVGEALAVSRVERTKAGARHVLKVPAVRALATDSRLLDIARQFVGPTPTPFRATLFDKSPTSNWLVVWHQDTALPLRQRITSPGWGPWSTKAGVLYAHAPAWALEQVIALRVCLDDSTATNGPLRVLPGTHKGGVFTDGEIANLAKDAKAVDCVASCGGVVAMRPLTVHASSKSTDRASRRVLHIEYAGSAKLGAGAELAVG
jgi:ectoine hydroxylase-related dioxygenase (phytanoyl-CoA dioxygenase family)